MRMYERFSGCRVLSYCVMTNHFHLLLEVPPPPSDGEFGISEEELIHRLGGLYSRAYVAGVKVEILEARMITEGKREHFSRLNKDDQKKEMAYGRAELAAIFERYTKRMHSLSEFMRGLLQRYTRWFNKQHGMRGTLWEDRFHSVIVQSGVTSRTMAAYIDLNPVRAGICKDPAIIDGVPTAKQWEEVVGRRRPKVVLCVRSGDAKAMRELREPGPKGESQRSIASSSSPTEASRQRIVQTGGSGHIEREWIGRWPRRRRIG